jgi:hypothetical protein
MTVILRAMHGGTNSKRTSLLRMRIWHTIFLTLFLLSLTCIGQSKEEHTFQFDTLFVSQLFSNEILLYTDTNALFTTVGYPVSIRHNISMFCRLSTDSQLIMYYDFYFFNNGTSYKNYGEKCLINYVSFQSKNNIKIVHPNIVFNKKTRLKDVLKIFPLSASTIQRISYNAVFQHTAKKEHQIVYFIHLISNTACENERYTVLWFSQRKKLIQIDFGDIFMQ